MTRPGIAAIGGPVPAQAISQSVIEFIAICNNVKENLRTISTSGQLPRCEHDALSAGGEASKRIEEP
jgi:hypothetical protein